MAAHEKTRFFDDEQLGVLKDAYPFKYTRLRHLVCDHPLLEHGRLQALAPTLSAHQHEYNFGKIDYDGHEEEKIPKNGLSIEKTIETIDDCQSWSCLHNVESDPVYKQFIDDYIDNIRSVVEPVTGEIFKPEGDIFVSSPHTVAPFHFDPQHNILMQIKGVKRLAVFDAHDELIVPPRRHEEYHHTGKANLIYDEATMASRGEVIEMHPGDAVFIPVKAPHWAESCDEVSISLSITWRSEQSDLQRRASLVNYGLRKLGLDPDYVSDTALGDRAKGLGYRVFEHMSRLVGHEPR